MKKHPVRNAIIDKFHRGFVYTCIGASIYAFSQIVSRFYHYYTVVKPQLAKQQLMEKEELLAEGSSEDKAPILKL
ncbi:uncharacterized protein [Leptinotarsa decemlineata]|uniref:uncharacterized protein n=1 Tax=Leptinotarsa decemlineata TaxID=7539 RepID=UPI000C252905|nr:uncharacterized protein LOC111509609 [Leptinotarsa decemlineata]